MILPSDCQKKYGNPYDEKHIVMWDVPQEIELGIIPNKLYCNEDLIEPLSRVFRNIINRGCLGNNNDILVRTTDVLKTWDGCFNIRKIRGSDSMSLHSWGVAVDVNAAWNQFGKKPSMGIILVSCFTDEGFDWGGYWRNPDGMHFQLSKI
jgi:hypothetical protein